MTKRGQKKLQAEQFNRACDLRLRLEEQYSRGVSGRLADASVYAIRSWLTREYRLGRASMRRDLINSQDHARYAE